MKHFVETFITLYGKHAVSHNVHGLIHMTYDAKLLGPLDLFSIFKFENCLRLMKRELRKSDCPLKQLHRRYSEKSVLSQNNILDDCMQDCYFKNHTDDQY